VPDKDPQFGTFGFGRLKYRTDDEARAVSEELGLGGIHQHSMDVDDDGSKETFHMPGENHDKLNEGLAERGLDPKPGIKAMGSQTSMGESDPMQTGSDGMAAMTDPDEAADMTLGIGTPSGLIGDRDEETGPFNLFGDSDDDGDMELY